jgi:hypothetical protein
VTYLETIPAIVRVLIVFGVILFAIRMKLSLGNAFVGGTALLGLGFGMAPLAIATSTLAALLHPKTISLAIVVCLILVLSNEYFNTGLRQVYRHMWFPCLILLACGYIYFRILQGLS